MAEHTFIEALEDLNGRVAIVTGGAAGIGLETTIYLAQRGATVYVASRNREKSEKGIEVARQRLQGHTGIIKFHHLDLSSIAGSRESAEAFKQIETRLDILVCNAGISMLYKDELSKDGYERVFATNHLGHFVFVTSLLDLIEKTAQTTHDTRVVITSSIGHKAAKKLDYTSLMERREADGSSLQDVPSAFRSYCDSKLANIYFTEELDRRLQARGVTGVYCNSCHPGTVANSGLGAAGPQPMSEFFQTLVRKTVGFVSNTTQDAAKTQTWLAAHGDVKTKDIHGQYWTPVWSWTLGYLACKKANLTALASDKEEQRKLWDYSEDAVKKAAT